MATLSNLDHGHSHRHSHHHGHHLEHHLERHDDSKEFISPPSNTEHHHTDHGESQHRDDVQRRLKIASFLCFTFLLAEVAGGLIAGSLAILSDAAHLFSDLMGFVFAVAAGYMATMPGSENFVSIYLVTHRRAHHAFYLTWYDAYVDSVAPSIDVWVSALGGYCRTL